MLDPNKLTRLPQALSLFALKRVPPGETSKRPLPTLNVIVVKSKKAIIFRASIIGYTMLSTSPSIGAEGK